MIVKPGDVDLMKGGSSRKVILMENFSGTPWAELKMLEKSVIDQRSDC